MSEELEVKYPRARAWLDLVRKAARCVESLQREISALEDARDELLPWQARGSGAGGHGTHSDPTASEAESRMEGLSALIASRRAELDMLTDRIGACGSVLMAMGSALTERHAQALELYYVDLADTWSDVAEEMGVTAKTVYRMRLEAYAWIESACRSVLLD